MGARVGLPENLVGSPFSVERARRAGIGAGRLRGADLARPFHGVRGHRVRPELVRVGTIGGLRVVSAVDAWCQLAAELTERELVVVGDALVRRRHPFTTMEALRRAVARTAGRRGSRRLVRALARVRPRTDSPAETELRLDLLDAGLPEPAVNVPIHDAAGRQIALGDLVYAEWRVVVEYDGGVRGGEMTRRVPACGPGERFASSRRVEPPG